MENFSLVEMICEQKGLELCYSSKQTHARALFIFYHCRTEATAAVAAVKKKRTNVY